MTIAKLFTLALNWSIAGSVLACTAGKNVDVYFSPGSGVPPSAEVRRLAFWVAEQRASVPTQQALEMSGYAESTEPKARELARLRLEAVQRLLTGWHFDQVPISTHYGVYPAGTVQNGRRVEISLLPACPNDCCHSSAGSRKALPVAIHFEEVQ